MKTVFNSRSNILVTSEEKRKRMTQFYINIGWTLVDDGYKMSVIRQGANKQKTIMTVSKKVQAIAQPILSAYFNHEIPCMYNAYENALIENNLSDQEEYELMVAISL